MTLENNARGFRRIVRRVQSALLPAVPFDPGHEGKGLWNHVTRAPQHVWCRYNIAAPFQTPLRCAILSDLHIGSHAGDILRYRSILTEVGARQFDLILLLGDFVNMQVLGGGRIKPDVIADLLAQLLKFAPVCAVLGNHDNEYGARWVSASLSEKGIQVLSNESARFDTTAGPIHVAGIEDHSTGRPDVARAMHGIPVGAPTLLLAHDPASFVSVPFGPLVTICGHTHGGQIRLPFVGPILNASAAPLAWTHGHIVDRGRHLIVSAGLGTSGLPWRWNCPPEIVELQLG